MPKDGSVWSSPISYDSSSVADIIREVLVELGYEFTRDTGQKHYSKLMVIAPLPKFAYVRRFIVTSPSEFVMDTYDTRPSHSGIIPYLDIKGVTDENKDDIRAVLQGIVDRLPRKPWKFTFAQRLAYALLSSRWRKARKAWAAFGFDVKARDEPVKATEPKEAQPKDVGPKDNQAN